MPTSTSRRRQVGPSQEINFKLICCLEVNLQVGIKKFEFCSKIHLNIYEVQGLDVDMNLETKLLQ